MQKTSSEESVQTNGKIVNNRCNQIEDGLPATASNNKDRGWAWLVLLASFMVSFIIDAVSFSAGLFFLEFLDYFEDSKSKTALVSSVLNGVYMSTGPVASVLAGKFGFRPVAMLGGMISATGFFLSTFSPNIDIVILTFGGLGGFGFGLLYLCSIAMIGEYFDKYRALATGIALSGSGIGVFSFAPVWQLLISKYSWKGAGWILSGIALNGVVFGAIYRPLPVKLKACENNQLSDKTDNLENSRNIKSEMEYLKMEKHHRSEHDEENQTIARTHITDRNIFVRVFQKVGSFGPLSVLKSPSFCLFGLSRFLYALGYYVPVTYLPDYAVGVGISKSQAAILVSILGVFNTLARVFAGWITDKPWANAVYLHAMGQLIGGVFTCLCSFIRFYWMLGVYAAVYGACIGGTVALNAIVIVDLLGVEKLKDTFGVVSLCHGIASLIGPPVAGLLYDTFQSYQPPFYFAGGTFILAAVLCFPVSKLDRWYKKQAA